MSNLPTLPDYAQVTPQQIEGVLRSAMRASHNLIGWNASNIDLLRPTFLSMYASSIFQLILGIPTQQPTPFPPASDPLKEELSNIKSTIQALSSTVNSLQPKAQGRKAPPPHKAPPPASKAPTQGKGLPQKT